MAGGRNKPLQLWRKQEDAPGAGITRVLDEYVQSSVIELRAAEDLSRTWIQCPADYNEKEQGTALHIRLRYLVLLIKNLQQELSLEVHVRDARGQTRRFRASTFQRQTQVHEQITLLPLQLDPAWNHLQLDLAALTQQVYGTRYECTLALQLHANCRVRRIFFTDALVAEADLPVEFRLFQRLTKQQIAGFRAHDEIESSSK